MDSGYAEMMHEVDVIEYRINKHYRQAEKELQEKINKFYKDFDRLDQKKRELVNSGKMTEAEYKTWRQNKIMAGKVWEQRKDVISRDLYNANYKARNMVYDELPDVYASAHNFATYQIENGAHIDTSYTLYNREAVERLIADNPDMIPYQEINKAKDISWNKKNLQAVMIQGVLQGESIPHLAKRLSKTVVQKNRACAIRNARTMATSVYNGGKMDAFKRAEALGVDLKVRWRATFDDRTRDSHRRLDGEEVQVGQPFSNGLTFPCDMDWLRAARYGISKSEKVINIFKEKCAETYNCRCTIQGVVKGLEPRAEKYRVGKIHGLTYEDWKKGKNVPQIRPKAQPKHPMTKKEPVKPKKTIAETVKEMFTPDTPSANYQVLWDRIKQNKTKIAHLPVKELKEKLSFDKIVERIAGGDDTSGSCSSLTYAYIANKMGYDVLDFRNGGSRKFFSKVMNTDRINQLDGIKREVYKVHDSARQTAEKLKELDLPHGKEYRLSVGRHAAIIRNTENGYEYLELQSGVKNGWHSFLKEDVYEWKRDENGKSYLTIKEQKDCDMERCLSKRFGCYSYESMFGGDMELTEVDSYYNTEFIDLMGYINTKENKQRKSIYGHER